MYFPLVFHSPTVHISATFNTPETTATTEKHSSTSVNSQLLLLHTYHFHISLEIARLIQLNFDKECEGIWNFLFSQWVSAVYGALCCSATHLVWKVLKPPFTLHTLYLFNRSNLRFGCSLSFQTEQPRSLKPLPLSDVSSYRGPPTLMTLADLRNISWHASWQLGLREKIY